MAALPKPAAPPESPGKKGFKVCIQCNGSGKIKLNEGERAAGEPKISHWDICPLCAGNGQVAASLIAKILGGGN